MNIKERKYRSKIIAENHLKKDAQRYLDQYVKSEMLTYKKIYLNRSMLSSMLIRYNFSKLNNALKNVGVSCAQASNAFQKIKESLSKFNDTLKDNFKA